MNYPNSKIFEQLAHDLNGEFIERNYDQSAKAKIALHKSYILFDNHTEFRTAGHSTVDLSYTRVVAPLKLKKEFIFTIERETILDKIFIFFGAQDVELGIAEFDKEYIIKSNDENMLKLILSKAEILEMIKRLGKVNLSISKYQGIWGDKLPENHFELSFFVENMINELDTFKLVYSLFVEIINQFNKYGLIQ